MKSATAINDGTGVIETREIRQGTALSALLHIAVLAAFVFLFRTPFSADIVAAGEGEGGGQGTAIEVGVVSASPARF